MSQTVIDWSQSYSSWVAGDGLALASFSLSSATINPQPWDWANLVASYIAADYDLTHRGTARSLKGRSANSTGVIADIAGGGADTVLHDDGSTLAFRSLATSIRGVGGSLILARSATPLDVSNTTTPTDLVNYSIPAATLAADRKLVVKMGGTYVNNSGGTRNFTFAVTLDGQTLYSDVSPNFAATALVRTWEAEITIAAESNTVVHMTGWVRIHTTNAPDTGLGALDNTLSVDVQIGTVRAGVTIGSLASGARTLAVTYTAGTNTATQTFSRTHYSVELKP